MRIALVSLDQYWQNRGENFKSCEQLAEIAVNWDCDIAVFPEMTLTAYSLDVEVIAESIEDSESLEWFAKLSKKTGLHLIFGTCLQISQDQKPRNELCYSNPLGISAPIYTKIHPFSYTGEEKVLEAGDELGFIDLLNVRLGASICYDLRFPELFSAMAEQCKGVVCIANWPENRIKHWETLLVARAIDNQLFMFGVNRIGVDGNNLRYKKSSMVVSPEGEIVAPIFTSTEIDIYEIELDDAVTYRDEFPTLCDKRPTLYEKL